ncbi:hypothetical protein D3C84_1150990 [compost metagenome]
MRQAAIELDGVYAGNAEDGVDAPGFELFDEKFAAGGHVLNPVWDGRPSPRPSPRGRGGVERRINRLSSAPSAQ